jgi:hypothetical protein
MGEALSRNKEWVQASANYTTPAFSSGDMLQQWSRPLRPFVHWILPACPETRRLLNDARSILEPLIK